MLQQIAYAAPFLVTGLLMTLMVSLITVALSLVIGAVLGIGLVYGPAPLRWVIRGFSDIVRGIPILVLLFYIYFVMPELGVTLTAVQAGILGLGIAY